MEHQQQRHQKITIISQTKRTEKSIGIRLSEEIFASGSNLICSMFIEEKLYTIHHKTFFLHAQFIYCAVERYATELTISV